MRHLLSFNFRYQIPLAFLLFAVFACQNIDEQGFAANNTTALQFSQQQSFHIKPGATANQLAQFDISLDKTAIDQAQFSGEEIVLTLPKISVGSESISSIDTFNLRLKFLKPIHHAFGSTRSIEDIESGKIAATFISTATPQHPVGRNGIDLFNTPYSENARGHIRLSWHSDQRSATVYYIKGQSPNPDHSLKDDVIIPDEETNQLIQSTLGNQNATANQSFKTLFMGNNEVPFIDVIFFQTPTSHQHLDPVETATFILFNLAFLNAAYINAHITDQDLQQVQYRGVHLAQGNSGWEGSSNNFILQDLLTFGANLRDQYGADVMQAMVHHPGQNFGGAAYLASITSFVRTELSFYTEPNSEYFSIAHEFGHLAGCGHEPAVGGVGLQSDSAAAAVIDGNDAPSLMAYEYENRVPSLSTPHGFMGLNVGSNHQNNTAVARLRAQTMIALRPSVFGLNENMFSSNLPGPTLTSDRLVKRFRVYADPGPNVEVLHYKIYGDFTSPNTNTLSVVGCNANTFVETTTDNDIKSGYLTDVPWLLPPGRYEVGVRMFLSEANGNILNPPKNTECTIIQVEVLPPGGGIAPQDLQVEQIGPNSIKLSHDNSLAPTGGTLTIYLRHSPPTNNALCSGVIVATIPTSESEYIQTTFFNFPHQLYYSARYYALAYGPCTDSVNLSFNPNKTLSPIVSASDNFPDRIRVSFDVDEEVDVINIYRGNSQSEGCNPLHKIATIPFQNTGPFYYDDFNAPFGSDVAMSANYELNGQESEGCHTDIGSIWSGIGIPAPQLMASQERQNEIAVTAIGGAGGTVIATHIEYFEGADCEPSNFLASVPITTYYLMTGLGIYEERTFSAMGYKAGEPLSPCSNPVSGLTASGIMTPN